MAVFRWRHFAGEIILWAVSRSRELLASVSTYWLLIAPAEGLDALPAISRTSINRRWSSNSRRPHARADTTDAKPLANT